MCTIIQDLDIYNVNMNTDTFVPMLLSLLEVKSQKLFLHSKQVAIYSVSVAAKMKLPCSEIERVKLAALLHDIGQISVPNAVLEKVPYLSAREMSAFKNHCNAGSSMLENIPCCQEIIPYVRYHHERFDGKGYPKRLKGVNIPLGARIIAVCSHYDRHINPCTNYWPRTKDEAVKELFSLSGMAFDSDVVKAFVDSLG